jgi:hypothetical protein
VSSVPAAILLRIRKRKNKIEYNEEITSFILVNPFFVMRLLKSVGIKDRVAMLSIFIVCLESIAARRSKAANPFCMLVGVIG